MIVIFWFPDERLWLDVLDNGGFDVLVFPFEREEITYIVGSACISCYVLAAKY